MELRGLSALAFDMLVDDAMAVIDGNAMYDEDERLVDELEASEAGIAKVKKMLGRSKHFDDGIVKAAGTLGVRYEDYLPLDEIKAMDAAVSRTTRGKFSLADLAEENLPAAKSLLQAALGHSEDLDRHEEADAWAKARGHKRGLFGINNAMERAASGTSVMKATNLILALARAATKAR